MSNKIVFEVLADAKNFEKNMQSIGKSMQSYGKTMTASITVPFVLLSAGLIKTASDAEEIRNKFSVVFKAIGKDADKWAEAFGDSVGRSTQEIQKFVASTGDILKPLGLSTEEAFKLSREMTKLAIDVASFNNATDADVVRDFNSALVGNVETVKKYGVALNQNIIEQKAIELGLIKTKNELTPLTKAQAIYQLILEGSADAQGDAIRTQDSFANTLKATKAELIELGNEFGDILLPIATDVLQVVKQLANSFKSLDESTKKFILLGGAIVAAIGPAVIVLGMLVSFANPITLSIGAIVTAVGLMFTAYKTNFMGIKILIDDLIEKFVTFKNRVIEIWDAVVEKITFAVEKIKGVVGSVGSFFGISSAEASTSGSTSFASSAPEQDLGVITVTQEIQAEVETETQGHHQRLLDLENIFNDQLSEIMKQRSEEEKKILTKGEEIYKQVQADKLGTLKEALQNAAELNKGYARALQIVSIGEAIMNTSLGVTAALSHMDFITATLIAIRGAIEIATIASQQFAVGTGNVPSDMVATVHRGETIVPSTFAESIRSGELSLSGGGNGGGVVFNFDGATFIGVTDEIVEDIFTKASENLKNNTLAFGGV